MIQVTQQVLGQQIRAEAVILDQGIDIGITGGSRTHVGAVALVEPDGQVQTLLRQGHKDDVVSLRWAKSLSQLTGRPVCVRCGIHYDNASKEDVAVILAGCEELLRTMEEHLKQGET